MKFPQVAPFPDDGFTRVLCVVAHPDDVEYGTSSAVAAWTAKGIEVAYLLLTRGEAGIDTMDPKATAELRVREQIKGSHEVGVTHVDFLEYPDGVLEYSIAMRRDIARAIRSFRPDALVVSAWDVEFPIGLNQADHRVAGLAVVLGVHPPQLALQCGYAAGQQALQPQQLALLRRERGAAIEHGIG